MDKELYNKLTRSAKIALDETMQEVAEKILEKAYKKAVAENTADKEISLRDIIEAKEEILYPNIDVSKQETRRKRISLMLSMTGAVYAVFGIVFYLFQNKNFDISKDLGLIIAALGIMMSIIAFYYTQLLSRRKVQIREEDKITERDYSEFEIVRRWQAIEKLGSELMIKDGISKEKSRSINFILTYLSNINLSNDYSNDLKEILMARNNIVHGGLKISKNELENLVKKADVIIEELEKKIQST